METQSAARRSYPVSGPPESQIVIGTGTIEAELTAADRTRRTIAQMLQMISAAVPAASMSAQPVLPDGSLNGPGVVYRRATLRATPQEVRREYVGGAEAEDPFHPRLIVATRRTLVGTHEMPAFLRGSSSSFLAYAREVDLPHVLRLFLRCDDQLVGYLWLARRRQDRPFHERQLTFLRRAQPFLESSFATAVRPTPRVEDERMLAAAGLTGREADVARYAATGLRTREIAELLVLTEATVKTHLRHVYRKLGVRGRAELAARLRPSA